MLQEAEIEHLPKGEFLVRGDCLLDLLTDFFPVSLVHSLFPQGDHQGDLGVEFVEFLSDSFGDLLYVHDFLFPEEAGDSGKCFESAFYELLCLGCVELFPGVVMPRANIVEPVGCGGPQRFIGNEILDESAHPRVIANLQIEELFPRIEQFDLVLELVQLFPHLLHLLEGLSMPLDLLVLVEGGHHFGHLADALHKLLLFLLHLILELARLLLQELLPCLDLVHDLLRVPEDFPFLIQILKRKLIGKALQDLVNAQGVLYLHLIRFHQSFIHKE